MNSGLHASTLAVAPAISGAPVSGSAASILGQTPGSAAHLGAGASPLPPELLAALIQNLLFQQTLLSFFRFPHPDLCPASEGSWEEQGDQAAPERNNRAERSPRRAEQEPGGGHRASAGSGERPSRSLRVVNLLLQVLSGSPAKSTQATTRRESQPEIADDRSILLAKVVQQSKAETTQLKIWIPAASAALLGTVLLEEEKAQGGLEKATSTPGRTFTGTAPQAGARDGGSEKAESIARFSGNSASADRAKEASLPHPATGRSAAEPSASSQHPARSSASPFHEIRSGKSPGRAVDAEPGAAEQAQQSTTRAQLRAPGFQPSSLVQAEGQTAAGLQGATPGQSPSMGALQAAGQQASGQSQKLESASSAGPGGTSVMWLFWSVSGAMLGGCAVALAFLFGR
jgi:hypothetical protein